MPARLFLSVPLVISLSRPFVDDIPHTTYMISGHVAKRSSALACQGFCLDGCRFKSQPKIVISVHAPLGKGCLNQVSHKRSYDAYQSMMEQ